MWATGQKQPDHNCQSHRGTMSENVVIQGLQLVSVVSCRIVVVVAVERQRVIHERCGGDGGGGFSGPSWTDAIVFDVGAQWAEGSGEEMLIDAAWLQMIQS